MNYLARRTGPVVLLSALGLVLAVCVPATHAQSIVVPDEPTPTMDVDDIRIGMKGYGMTVFQGTAIEPFNLEVVSIVPNATAARSVIWVRCTDPRMVESGPVQGMSGSPIYLWDEGEPHDLGKGGKLIGAFAFGFTESKQCMVGVQPIGYMRESATRVENENDKPQANHTRHGSARQTVRLLNNLKKVPGYEQAPPVTHVRIGALRDLMLRSMGRATGSAGADTQAAQPPDTLEAPGPYSDTSARRLMLPLSVGSYGNAEALGPLFEPMGLMPVAGEVSAVSGKPPHGIDPAAVSLQPGSVLAIPLGYGDMDLSASGTVTDVLPTGEVLAFGHPMFGMGDAQVPMATGYVHFVMPRNTISFKRGSSLIPVGTLVRDESAAVVGIRDIRYTAAPVQVTLNMLDQEARTYHYQVVNEPSLSAVIIANVILGSVEAVHGMPVENTIRLKADMRFTGGRELNLDTLIAGGSGISAIFEILPAVAVMVQNPYADLEVESVNIEIGVEEGVRMSNLINARLERAEVAPGDTVKIQLDLQRYGQDVQQRTISFKVPDDLDEGDYPLMLTGVDSYASMKLSSQPHLLTTRNIDDLVTFIQTTMDFKTDALYAVMQLPETGLAVGRTEMPDLPSSRAAILTSPTHTDAMPYMRLVEQTYDSDTVILGQVGFTLNVRKR